MNISVIVPSYRRHIDLDRCLDALSRQSRRAQQVLVVARVGDSETLNVAAEWLGRLPLEIVEVTEPGVVGAMNAGLARCRGDLIAITDDDAAPRPDWLARIEAHFAVDETLGGVGGRDWMHHNGVADTGQARVVGKLRWFGRVAGNHHLGAGPVREVDILKGANCAFRMSAIKPIGFETRLRGTGAQVHWEMCLCFAIQRAGWRLIYDPAVAVDHYPAQRFDRDQRGVFDPVTTSDRAYNFRLALQQIRPAWRRRAAIIWFHAVGMRDTPGCLNALRLMARRDPHAWQKFKAARGGRGGL